MIRIREVPALHITIVLESHAAEREKHSPLVYASGLSGTHLKLVTLVTNIKEWVAY